MVGASPSAGAPLYQRATVRSAGEPSGTTGTATTFNFLIVLTS